MNTSTTEAQGAQTTSTGASMSDVLTTRSGYIVVAG